MRALPAALLLVTWALAASVTPVWGQETEAVAEPPAAPQPRQLPAIPATLRGGKPVEDYLRAVADSIPADWPVHIWVEQIGRSQQGRPIQMVTAAAGDLSVPPKSSVMVIAAQHGDEPAGTRAVLRIIHGLALKGSIGGRTIPDGVAVHLVPVANPDGACVFKRMTANGKNLNRDWHSHALPETRAIAQMISALRQSVLIDLHEQTPLCPGSVYVTGAPANRASGLVKAAVAALKNQGLKIPARPASRSANTKLLHHNFAAVYGRPALLVESRYTRRAEADLGTRSAIHITTVMAVIDAVSARTQGTASSH